MNLKIVFAILVLAFTSMACGFSIDLPENQKARPEVEGAAININLSSGWAQNGSGPTLTTW